MAQPANTNPPPKINLALTEEEFAGLQQLVDIGLKSAGMGAVRLAAHLLNIFEQAAAVARAEQQAEQMIAQAAAPAPAAPVAPNRAMRRKRK